MSEADQQPECDTFISFATSDGFLGALALPGRLSVAAAMAEATRLGLNPGGEALLFQIEPGSYPHGQLFSRAELEEIDAPHGGCRSLGDMEDGELEALSRMVCGSCNPATGN